MKSPDTLSIADVEAKLIPLRGQFVILDRDVAALYGVQTKRINEAVRNNIDKFPAEYMYELDREEVELLRTKFSTANISSKSRVATFAIIETFAKVCALKRELLALHNDAMPIKQKTSMLKHFGEILTDLVMPDPDSTETESSLELNFFVGKLKHTVRRVKKHGKR